MECGSQERCVAELRPILPVHGEAVAALVALHFLGLPRHVLALVTAGAYEMGFVHDAPRLWAVLADVHAVLGHADFHKDRPKRSEEHTSELQSQSNLVCRLLLEKKKKRTTRARAHKTQ